MSNNSSSSVLLATFGNIALSTSSSITTESTTTNSLIDGLFTFQVFIFAVVCLIGLIGNTLVIYVVVRFSKMQTVTNMYILNLAIADEFFLVGIPFLMVTVIMKYWIFGNILCKLYMILTSMNQYTSSTFLCIMSADRYIAVCHPISSTKWRTPLISTIVSVAAWVWSLMLIIPIIIYSQEVVDPDTQSPSCIINFETGHNRLAFLFTHQHYIWYTFTFSFAVPLVLIVISYCFVILKLRTVGPQNKSKEKKRSHRKVTNLVLAVITVYILCWMPYWVGQLAMVLTDSQKERTNFEKIIHILCSCLSYSNSAVNPILYAFLSDNFKKSFLKACSCAAGADINATLHLENSVFPRRNNNKAVAGGGGGGGGGMAAGGGSTRYRATAPNYNKHTSSICPQQQQQQPCGSNELACCDNDDDDDDDEAGYDVALVSKGEPTSTSAITMTSRSNITLTSSAEHSSSGGGGRAEKEVLMTTTNAGDPAKVTVVKNGVGITFNC